MTRVWVWLRDARNTWWVFGSIALLGAVARIPQLFHSLNEAYAFRQTQTAFVVRQYAENGIDLAHTPLPVFGVGSDVPMEFPLWQAAAALLAGAGLPVDVAARLLGLLSFTAASLVLAALVRRWHGRRVAVLSLLLLQFLPFGLLWGASSLIDFAAVALALGMVLTLDHWFDRGGAGWLVGAVVVSVVGFLVKVTTMPAWGILLLVAAVLVIRRDGWARSWRRLLAGFALGPGLGFAAGVGWTIYADSVKNASELTRFVTSSELRDWNFGTLAQRLDFANSFVILDRIAQEIAGPFLVGVVLGALAIAFARTGEQRLRRVGWLGVAVSAPVVFFNLYVVHSYYLIAVYPALVVLVALGADWFVRSVPGPRIVRIAVPALGAAALIVATALSPLARSDIAQFARGQQIPAVSSVISQYTATDARIVMIGCDWDPTFLYYAEREGLMFRGADSGSTWTTERIADYDALFSCRADLDPADYVPGGTELVPVEGVASLWRITS